MRRSALPLYLLMGFIGLCAAGAAGVALWKMKTDADLAGTAAASSLLLMAIVPPLVAGAYKRALIAPAVLLSCVLVGIWFALYVLSAEINAGWFTATKVASTAGVLLLAGIPSAIALVCRTKPWGLVFCWSAVAVACVTALPALFLIWTAPDEPSDAFLKWMECCGWVGLSAGVGAVLLINIGRRDKRYFRWVGLLAAIVAVAAGITGIWRNGDPNRWAFAAEIALIATATLGFVNMFLMTRKPGLVRAMQIAAIVLACILGGITITLTSIDYAYPDLTSDDPKQYLLVHLMAAVSALGVGAALCLIVARAALRITRAPVAMSGIDGVQIQCPNCGLAQRAPLSGACRGCLLQFRIAFTEPRCAQCDHILLNLTSDRCPECGAAVKRPADPPPPERIPSAGLAT